MKLIDKDALVAEFERLKAEALQKKSQCKRSGLEKIMHQIGVYNKILSFLDTLEVKEVDNVWHEVDNVNMPQPDKNKIYCVLSKNKYLLARVIDHPHDELLQWKCTEFPHHCYDMCEGDKYMQIV